MSCHDSHVSGLFLLKPLCKKKWFDLSKERAILFPYYQCSLNQNYNKSIYHTVNNGSVIINESACMNRMSGFHTLNMEIKKILSGHCV